MLDKLTIVMSLVQDECTLCNRIFEDYNDAYKYKLKTEEETGCDLAIFSAVVIKKGEDPYGV